MNCCGAEMTSGTNVRERRLKLRWTIGIVAVLVLLLGLGGAYYVRSNLPADLTRIDVVGTWVSADGGAGVAVFRDDGTTEIRNIPGGTPPTGRGRWNLSGSRGPTVSVQVGSSGFDFSSKWENFRTVLIAYSGDPDDPGSEHVFIRKTRDAG